MRRLNLPGMTISAQDAIDQEMRDNELLEEQELDQDMNILDNPQSYSLPTPVSIDEEIQTEADNLLNQLPVENAIEEANEEVSNPYTDSKPQLSFQDKLKMLQDAQRRGRMTSDIMSGAGMMSDAIARGYGGSTAFDPKSYGKQFETRADADLAQFQEEEKLKAEQERKEAQAETMRKYRDKMVKIKEDAEKRRKALDEVELDRQEMLNDPDSDLSKSYREMARNIGIKVGDKISARQLEKSFPQLAAIKKQELYGEDQKELEAMRAITREKRDELKLDREKRLDRQNKVNTVRNFLKDDPGYKVVRQQEIAFEPMERDLDLIEKEGNESTIASLGTRLARAMGEVGVLTDTDVVRYVGSTSWGRKLKDWYIKGAKGELPPELINDLRNNIQHIKRELTKSKARIFERAASRVQAAYPDMEMKDVYGILGAEMPKVKVPVKLADGQMGKIDEDKVDAFLKKYPDAEVLNNDQ